MKKLFNLIFSPRLFVKYRTRSCELEVYKPNGIEHISNRIYTVVNFIWSWKFYAAAVFLPYYVKKWGISSAFVYSLSICGTFYCVLYGIFFVRLIGRFSNIKYRKFISILNAAKIDPEQRVILQEYDFDFSGMPIDFIVSADYPKIWTIDGLRQLLSRKCVFLLEMIRNPFAKAIPAFLVNTFGIKMLYPGCMELLGSICASTLLQLRCEMRYKYGSQRYKIVSSDHNEIDVMLADRRQNNTLNDKGNTLIICCEGNGGFYETGITATPLNMGYSVLGWNHPGFGGSTGLPFPSQEKAAIDAVMQFALVHLGFEPMQIILMGWSIGGFSAAWAASQYPDIRGLIVDASFDELLPLALPRMPVIFEPLVKLAVANFLDLNVASLLKQFSGRIILVRRSRDEMVALDPQDISTNRCNFLLSKLLKYRYPLVFGSQQLSKLYQYLGLKSDEQRDNLFREAVVDYNLCIELVEREDQKRTYPSNLGQDFNEYSSANLNLNLALHLARHHLFELDTGHCETLSRDVLAVLVSKFDKFDTFDI